ncbi:MAG: NnrU family protein [Cellvibrionaceae bacterium]
MTALTLGLLIFLGVHCLPHYQAQRELLIRRVGAMRYKGLFSITSAIGLGLIIIGMMQREYTHLWTPPLWSRDLVIGAMLPASILLCAANFPNNIRRLSQHPMLIGLLLWSGSHLLANGDLASLLLFGGFLCFSAFDLWSVTRASRIQINKTLEPTSLWLDLVVLILGIAAYAALLWWHGDLFGVALIKA